MHHAIRLVVAGLVLAMTATVTVAAEPTCGGVAAEKKLTGAAKSSFLKKCEADAKASCETDAATRKLVGAAKNSMVGKCVKDAVGM